jgi:hypothetical protein
VALNIDTAAAYGDFFKGAECNQKAEGKSSGQYQWQLGLFFL